MLFIRRFGFLLACSAIVSGCSLHSAVSNGPNNSAQFAVPIGAADVVQKGAGATWVKLTPHTSGALGAGIVAGPDGNMWFIDENAGALVRLSMTGAIKEFSMSGHLGSNAISLGVGADHKLYVANESAKIVRVTTGGLVQDFTTPSGDSTAFGTIILGPDGNMWFPEVTHLGMITPTGVIKEFKYPTGFGNNTFGTITVGADHNLWFSESGDNAIVRFIIATKTFKEFKVASTCPPLGVVKANDNNVWFACFTSASGVGRITTAGNIKLFPGGGRFSGQETFQIGTLGPDGNAWYESSDTNTIFRISANGTVTSFSPPFISGERPDSIATGPDGNIWVTTVGLNNVYIFVFNALKLTPLTMTFPTTGQTQNITVSEDDTTHWTATSSNVAVATVTQGTPANTFIVRSVGDGVCRITVVDGLKNSAGVRVTVH